MLPTLSDKLGANLLPVRIAPSVFTARRNALLDLKRIEAVNVCCAAKKDCFVVEVLADSPMASSGLATIEEIQEDPRARRPAVRIERTLLDFIELRNRVYDIVHGAHSLQPCEFCAGFLDQVVFGANPDGFLVGLLGGKRLSRTLTKFVQELLALTVQHTCTDARGCCAGQTSVPQVVHAFVFTPSSDAA